MASKKKKFKTCSVEKPKFIKKMEILSKITAVILSSILIIYISFFSIPNLYFKTENGILEKVSEINMKTNFGNLEIILLKETKITRENFLNSVYHGYYNDSIFHRIVKHDNFSVIQGGDIDINLPSFQDEIWDFPPQLYSEEERLENNKFEKKDPFPVPLAPNYYSLSYNEEYGVWENVYRKGLLIMANAGENTNTTQFFITLEDTILQPNYTVFGYVKDSSFKTLNKILEENYPVNDEGLITEDGYPKNDIIISKITYKNFKLTPLQFLKNLTK